MKEPNYRKSLFGGLWIIALLALAAGTFAAQKVTEITLPGTRVFPESITSTPDGTLIVGSLGHGNVMRIAPGTTTAEEWIKPGTAGLNSILGVFADRKKQAAVGLLQQTWAHRRGDGRQIIRFENWRAEEFLRAAGRRHSVQ